MIRLVKHYDFTNQNELDRDEWNIAVGEKWHNKELQQYVDTNENIYFDNGLHLKATYENGIIKSGRINTKNKFTFTYGKIEVLAKVPKGKGTWPAIWMMPNEDTFGHWPKSGEIDIMEHVGNDLDNFIMCLHTEAHNHVNGDAYGAKQVVDGLSDDFQLFSLDWEANQITYYINNEKLVSYKRGEDGKDETHRGWPFIHPYYLILNLAIGGMLGGEVDYNSFPQEFVIKDIKVYQK